MKVNMHAKTPPSQEPDAMCKKSLFAQNGKKQILQQGVSWPLVVPKTCYGPRQTCLQCKSSKMLAVSMSPKSTPTTLPLTCQFCPNLQDFPPKPSRHFPYKYVKVSHFQTTLKKAPINT